MCNASQTPRQGYSSDMKHLILVALLFVLTFHNIAAIPLKCESSESTESWECNSSSSESSNESVYVIKGVSYEVGLVGILDRGNSSRSVVITPEDRIETEDIVLWTSSNGQATESDSTTNASPTEAALPTNEVAPASAGSEVDTTSSPSEVHTTSPPSLSATELETTSTINEVRK